MKNRTCCRVGQTRCCKSERSDFQIKVKEDVLAEMPLACFLEMASGFVEKGYYEIPGLRFKASSGTCELDLEVFSQEGREIVAIELAKFFGGLVREFLFPSQQGGRKIFYMGDYRRAFGEEPQMAAESSD